MKIRNGFVSNSSSSSFIIGVGKLVDEEKFNSYCKEKQIEDFEIYTTKEILEYQNKWNSIKKERDGKVYLYNDSFMYDEVSIEIDPTKDEKFIKVSYYGDEGDHFFCEEDDYEADYDIDCGFFEENGGAEYLDFGKDSGVENYECSYGAGRNG